MASDSQADSHAPLIGKTSTEGDWNVTVTITVHAPDGEESAIEQAEALLRDVPDYIVDGAEPVKPQS